MKRSMRPGYGRVLLALVLVAVTIVAGRAVMPPQAEPATAPAGTVSGVRAMRDLRVVAAEPHPIGSSAQHEVRDYLVAQGRALGLPTQVQRSTVDGRRTENVVVRLPGAGDTDRDVLVTAHYDSAPAAPGATDDGVPVVAMLETMRALKAGEPLTNDVVFLFTDGEELAGPMGGLGMQAFVEEHPAAGRVGVAFAFECLPESSGTTLRTTTPGDAWLVGQLRQSALPVFANSATNASDRDRAGNDFAAFAPAGWVGAELLSSGDRVRYHNAGDNVAAVDPGVVQDFGDTMLGLASHFGATDLTRAQTSDADRVFLTVPGVGLVDYPLWLAELLAVVVAAGFVAVVVVARRRRGLRLGRLAAGAAAFLGLMVTAGVAAWATWQVALSLNPESADTLQTPDFERSTTVMVAVMAAAVVGYTVAAHWLSRRIGALELVAGALLWPVLATLLISFGEPLFSPVVVWVALGGVAGFAVAAFVDRPGWLPVLLLALASVPSLVVVIPLALLEAFDVEDGPMVAVPALGLLVGSLLPQLLTITGRMPLRPASDLRAAGEGVDAGGPPLIRMG